ncbi:zinc finger protein ZFP2 isoform X1 [Dendroctonus ponderosae]|nr:zinc finger protein ZFP2 isoform X1 [Dendroctonus ponderosae]KAH1024397.1 hypothetical protein HUJ05_003883 [Dendroctonus ponderosae]
MEKTDRCRICRAKTNNLQNIFTCIELEDCKATLQLSDMICSFTQVQITLYDGLPDQICGSCTNATVQMYLFKLRIEESDRFLRNKLLETESSSLLSENIFRVGFVSENADTNSENVKMLSSFDCQHFLNQDNEEAAKQDINVARSQKAKKCFCSICNKKFAKEDSLLKHKIGHLMEVRDVESSILKNNDNIELKGQNSPVIYFKTVALDPNNANLEGNVQCFSCVLCNCIFLNEELLKKHLNDHAIKMKLNKMEDGYFLCKLCEYETNDIQELKVHTRRKHSEKKSNNKSFSCSHCLMDYSKEGYSHNHLEYHINDEKDVKLSKKAAGISDGYSCNHCDMLFETKVQLRRHLRKSNRDPLVEPEKKPHVCQICLKAFNQLSNLKDHMRTHNGEKPFLCPTCGKGFNQQGNLKQHQVRHSGVKSHKCTICNSGFASRGELKAHLRKHTGARPFVCSSCGNGFTTSSSLTKHKRIHSGEKPYECEFCKMKFSRSGILTRHRRIHTGEKPYICNICEKAFTQSNDLTSHQRIHTGEKPYKCDECGQPFRQSSALKTHRKVHLATKPKQIKQQSTPKEKAVFVEDGENLLISS